MAEDLRYAPPEYRPASPVGGGPSRFMDGIIEDHIREQVIDADSKGAATEAAEELIGIVHSYLT